MHSFNSLGLLPGMHIEERVWYAYIFPVWHSLVVSDRVGAGGLPYVIDASKETRRVRERPWSEAIGDSTWRIGDVQSAVSRREVLRRARADLGKDWTLFSSNCEHYTRRWMGLPEHSEQLLWKGAVVGCGVVAIAVGVAMLVAGGAAAGGAAAVRGRRPAA